MTTEEDDDAPDAEEPDAGHLREAKKGERSEKSIRAGAVSLVDLAAELFANRVRWSASADRIRNVVACLYHANFRRKRGLAAILTAQAACDGAIGSPSADWVPASREEVAEALKRARDLAATVPIPVLKRKGSAGQQPALPDGR